MAINNESNREFDGTFGGAEVQYVFDLMHSTGVYSAEFRDDFSAFSGTYDGLLDELTEDMQEIVNMDEQESHYRNLGNKVMSLSVGDFSMLSSVNMIRRHILLDESTDNVHCFGHKDSTGEVSELRIAYPRTPQAMNIFDDEFISISNPVANNTRPGGMFGESTTSSIVAYLDTASNEVMIGHPLSTDDSVMALRNNISRTMEGCELLPALDQLAILINVHRVAMLANSDAEIDMEYREDVLVLIALYEQNASLGYRAPGLSEIERMYEAYIRECRNSLIN